MTATIDLQIACAETTHLPSLNEIQHWCNTLLRHQDLSDKEITIRIVDEEESHSLNKQYRGKDKPTNVLSFPFDAPEHVTIDLLGDLVICEPVVLNESKQQEKDVKHHWAHLIIHGCLHLLGYDHINDDEAEEMEAIEIAILAKLSIDDPYLDH
ncbi:rRNA maturation RNase YbeY [Alteromonadaceae bacterium M269]|nr:rRNA maturation RNase YbeY [Alteromonadaceae bacterium M269]